MSYEQFLADLGKLLIQFKENLIAFFPQLVLAIVIVLVGIIVARIFRALVNRFIGSLDRFVANRKVQGRLKQLQLERSGKLVGKMVYWIIIVFFLTAATEVLGMPIITTWLSGLVRYLPNILIAVMIVLLGIIGGRLVNNFITTTSSTAGLLYGNMLGRIAQYVILLITILVAVDQIGIEIAILTGVINIVIAAILFGAALAFGLGARTSVNNILASYYLQGRYREGQTVKIGDLTGQIIQITPTAVILQTEEGQVSVPAKKFSEDISTLVKREGATT